MTIRLSTDLLTGLLFCILGLGAIYLGADYPVGTAARMGAGYFPLMISACLIGLGLVLVVRSFVTATEPLGEIAIRPLATVVASTLLFAFLIEDYGFPVAGAVLVLGVALAGRGFRPVQMVLLTVGLVVFCTVVFVYLLGLNLPHARVW